MIDPEKLFKQMEALQPVFEALLANPGLVVKAAQDASQAAQDASKLAADVAALAERIAALEAHPAVSIPPLPQHIHTEPVRLGGHHISDVTITVADPNTAAVESNKQE